MKYAIQLEHHIKGVQKDVVPNAYGTVRVPLTAAGWIEVAPTIDAAIEQFVNRQMVLDVLDHVQYVLKSVQGERVNFVLAITEEDGFQQFRSYEQWGSLIKSAAIPTPEPILVPESEIPLPEQNAQGASPTAKAVFPLEVQPPPAPGEPYVTMEMLGRLEKGASIVFRDARGVGVAFVDFVREIKRLNRVNAELQQRVAELAASERNADFEGQAVAKMLDERNVPRTEDDGSTLTLWGRVLHFATTEDRLIELVKQGNGAKGMTAERFEELFEAANDPDEKAELTAAELHGDGAYNHGTSLLKIVNARREIMEEMEFLRAAVAAAKTAEQKPQAPAQTGDVIVIDGANDGKKIKPINIDRSLPLTPDIADALAQQAPDNSGQDLVQRNRVLVGALKFVEAMFKSTPMLQGRPAWAAVRSALAGEPEADALAYRPKFFIDDNGVRWHVLSILSSGDKIDYLIAAADVDGIGTIAAWERSDRKGNKNGWICSAVDIESANSDDTDDLPTPPNNLSELID